MGNAPLSRQCNYRILFERVAANQSWLDPPRQGKQNHRAGQEPDGPVLALRQRVIGLRAPTAADFLALGHLAMAAQQTPLAIDSFQKARASDPSSFRNDLELGVLYLAARRFTDARDALDRVPAAHPAYPMALFKRAQVSVLLGEADSAARIALARRRADATTRELIEREKLFR